MLSHAQSGRFNMKYLLLIYGNEAAMMSADKKTVEQMMAA